MKPRIMSHYQTNSNPTKVPKYLNYLNKYSPHICFTTFSFLTRVDIKFIVIYLDSAY